MKLNATDLRYMSAEEFRVLTAVEMGSKNHEIVPSVLIARLSGLRGGGVNKYFGELARRNLISKVKNATYDGYRLTYGGYDFLAMRTFAKRDSVYSVGNQIGTGKESDIYVVATQEAEERVLKIHRLGRISFRTIKSKRDYLQNRKSASWMYMSRLAALKEYTFMKVLHQYGFPVPKPIDQSRHCLVMEFIESFPLRSVSDIADPGALYSELMDLIVRLARSGLIHGDFNEFNILVSTDDEGRHAKPILIDFPQMVSTEHENAEYYFNRDVNCIRDFFRRRFRYESSLYPKFSSIIKNGKRDFDLDVVVEASGFSKKDDQALLSYIEEVEGQEHDSDDDDSEEEEDEGTEEEESEEEEDDEQDKEQKNIEENKSQDEKGKETEKVQQSIETLKIESENENEAGSGSEDENSDDSDEQEEEDEDDAEKLKAYTAKKQEQRRKDLADRLAQEQKKYRKGNSSRTGAGSTKNLGRKKGSKAKQNPNRQINASMSFF